MDVALRLRPAQPEDATFLEHLYGTTRIEELAITPWTDLQKAAFIHQQFTAQTEHYHQHYPTAEYHVIEHQERPVGRLYVDRWTREIRIMDIALLPTARGQGIGSQFLRQLQAEAERAQKTLSIHVEKFNPALRLYQRLDFQPIEDKGVYLLMEWRAPAAN